MGTTTKEVVKGIMFTKYNMPYHVITQAQSLIRELLTVDTIEKFMVEEIIMDLWLSQGEDYLPHHYSEPLQTPRPHNNDNPV